MTMTDDMTQPTQEQETASFHAKEKLMTLPGKGLYMQVKDRVLWFNSEHPTSSLAIEYRDIDWDAPIEVENWVYVDTGQKDRQGKPLKSKVLDTAHPTKIVRGRATFTYRAIDSNGKVTHGTKTCTAAEFEDFVEKAETGAIGRALAFQGYGTADALDIQEDIPVDAPVKPKNDPAPLLPSLPGLPKPAVSPAPATPPVQQQQQQQQKATSPAVASSETPSTPPSSAPTSGSSTPRSEQASDERVALQEAITGYLSKVHLFSPLEQKKLRLRVTGGVDIKVSDLPMEQLTIFKMMLQDAYPFANIGYALDPDGKLLREDDLRVNSVLEMYGNDKDEDHKKRALYLKKLIRAYQQCDNAATKRLLGEQHKKFLEKRGFLAVPVAATTN